MATARELLALCGGALPERVIDVLRKRKRQRSAQTVHLWQRLNAHPGSKTNAPLDGGNMPAFSVIQAKPGGWEEGGIICIMWSQSVHLLVESLERKTALC